ncbi:MAG: hypothetical protein HUU29_12840 [Planctomycetaceae bacterium]|nr:hypothetical protein [Planctomycetaceae bacterium]
MFTPPSGKRHGQRGMLLIVVLGVLVVLSLIGIAFGFLVSTERRSAQNALDRYRAMSAAKDGEAYAIAALRQVALTTHYEGEAEWSFNRMFNTLGRPVNTAGSQEPHTEYLRRWVRDANLSSMDNGSVASLSRRHSTSNESKPDSNWVDANGDGNADPSERVRGNDLAARAGSPLDQVSYFAGDGIDMRMLGGAIPAGTYRELGDRARLKIIDTNAQLNINDYAGLQLEYMLTVLGNEIALTIGSQRYNPFPPAVAREIVLLQERYFGKIPTKDALRQFFPDERLYTIAMDFIAVRSWPAPDSGVEGTQPSCLASRNPHVTMPISPWLLGPAQRRLEPYSSTAYGRQPGSESGLDGNPEQLPECVRTRRSPVNLNTVSKPVLTAMLAGIEAQARFFYFPNIDLITVDDRWAAGVRQLAQGTTDYGQQPLVSGFANEIDLTHGDVLARNLSIYQWIPVGPLGYGIHPPWKTMGGLFPTTQPMGGNHASHLAGLIIQERDTRGPYTSWMDFDYRICHQILCGFGRKAGSEECADLVNTGRRGRLEQLPTDFDAMPAGNDNEPMHLLPDPDEVLHGASPRNSSSRHSYTAQEFNAWYWRACVDMIRANFNPNGLLSKFNPDAANYSTVDVTDLCYSTAPACFNTCGVYEIVSQGEIVREHPLVDGRDLVMARRTFRSVVEVYRVAEHTTQRDFLRGVVSELSLASTTSEERRDIPSLVYHDLKGTQTYPCSINHLGYTYANRFADQPYRAGKCPKLERDALLGGYFDVSAASTLFGWVTQHPRDMTANPQVRDEFAARSMNFHAPYNIHLGAVKDMSLNGNRDADGAFPFVNGIVPHHADSWNSATPDPALRGSGTGLADPASPDAALYATLRPDGVLLRGWHLNSRFRRSGELSDIPTFGARGERRPSRLVMLRYRAGAIGDNALSPIAGVTPLQSDEVLPGSGASPSDPATIVRLVGLGSDGKGTGGDQGTDNQNIVLQDIRQRSTNFPYYQGWIDFWIKWELPPQGKPHAPACAGEIDPGSGNFSGLIGACSYGRFATQPYTTLDDQSDFEGAEFFVFKEPGGMLRITHVCFSQAESASNWVPLVPGASTLDVPAGWKRIGSTRRIYGDQPAGSAAQGQQQMTLDEYIGTNDICSREDDLGFSYARMDSYVDLSSLEQTLGVELVTHNWYRFSLSYRSNPRYEKNDTGDPHQLYIDGKLVPLTFIRPSLTDPQGANTGEVTDENGNPTTYIWPDKNTPERYILPQRSQSTLVEVDPEDRLTIGCVFRRNNPLRLLTLADSQSVSPLFRFDTNLVAPANATLDDVRIHHELQTSHTGIVGGMLYRRDEFAPRSRYERAQTPSQSACYENGFIASPTGAALKPYLFPVRLGSLSWTEYRPWWDSYDVRRVDLQETRWANAPQVTFGLEIIGATEAGSARGTVTLPAFTSINPSDSAFWRAGGITFNRAYGGSGVTLSNMGGANMPRVALLKYTAYFITPSDKDFNVLNTSAVLDDVRLTLLTPPRRLLSEEIVQ